MSSTPIDPRDVVEARIGTPMRDGAVDPKPGDFLGPTNAGKPGAAGNPHGPNVMSPGIHANEGNRTIVPGAVSSSASTQQAAEVAGLIASIPSAAPQE